MTGRQLLRRPSYDVDIEGILAACAEHGVPVEINGNPWRLDLDWRFGCMFSINPDAHSIDEIEPTHWENGAQRRCPERECIELPRPQGHQRAFPNA